MTNAFVSQQRANAARWKSTLLPETTRLPAPYAGRGRYDFCLPVEHAAHNLLPGVRGGALALFAELGNPWHRGVAGGPTNHLLSSQVQCANALMPMVTDPVRIVRAFGLGLDIAEVIEIESGRFLTFEYISPTDYLSESKDDLAPAAPTAPASTQPSLTTSTGATELALVEWKFTESYSAPHDPTKTPTRAARYRHLVEAADSPIRRGIPFEWLLDEPFYQLVRQQLLAHALEADPSTPYDAVRALHVLDPTNTAYQASIVNPLLREYGDTVGEIWAWILASPDRFEHFDPMVFLATGVSGDEYVKRYGAHPTEEAS